MIKVFIDNLDLKATFGIDLLDYTGILGIASERVNERVWSDKSGVDKNLINIRYDDREFVISCLCYASNEVIAYNNIKLLTDYMFSKGCFVLSLRDTERGVRECFICQRSGAIVGDINVRQQNGLFVFKLGLKDINPNAVTYKKTIVNNSVSIDYEKGQTADIYWGDGTRTEVSNSGTYTKSDYDYNGEVDIIIDVDKTSVEVNTLQANFSANIISGVNPQVVSFTDLSVGDISIWSWNFGDGSTSALQNPTHTYQTGTYTVTLQAFNSAGGFAVETKTNYITVRASRLLFNSIDSILFNATDKLLIN